MAVFRMYGLGARSELEALWTIYGIVEAVRVGCLQRVGGFMEVFRLCGLAARSELEALWGC